MSASRPVRDIQSLTTNVRSRGLTPRDHHSTNVRNSRSIIQSSRSASGQRPFHPERGGASIIPGQRWPGGDLGIDIENALALAEGTEV
jgi:hypothetical protein